MTWPLSRCGRLGRQRPPTARSITARVSNDEAVPRAQARSRSPTASPPGSASSRMTTSASLTVGGASSYAPDVRPYSQHRPSLAVDRDARSSTGRLQSSATISNGTHSSCVGPGFDSRGGSLSRLDIPPGQAAGTRAGPDGDPGANSF
jgi:hypothetical protein